MSIERAPENVVVEIPVTLRVAVTFPEGAPPDPRRAAEQLARQATESFTHISASRIQAFNAVNRIHAFASGEVCSVVAKDQAAR